MAKSAAQRQREKYQREKQGRRPFPIDANHVDSIAALVASGAITTTQAENPERLRIAASDLWAAACAKLIAEHRPQITSHTVRGKPLASAGADAIAEMQIAKD